MTEIKINFEKLEELTGELRTLQASLNELALRTVQQVGGGKSIIAINKVDKEYTVLRNAMNALLDSSINFFENLKQSFATEDENIASNIER